LSSALQKQKIASKDIINFISMAEKSTNFRSALERVVHFIEVKEEFKRESNDKTSLPITYFFIASLVVLGVKFYAVPLQIERSLEYSPEIVKLISEHLLIAQIMTNTLFLSLLFFGVYFLILLIALFDKSYTIQNTAKKIALYLPFSATIVTKFEKFSLFSMLSEMLQSGVSIKNAITTAAITTSIYKFKEALVHTLEGIKTDGKLIHHPSLYDNIEQELLAGAGNSKQLASIMHEIAQRAKADAKELSTKFFRLITIISILLMAFAVFIEFYTIVLTQVLIQKGMIDAVRGGIF
ncbi:MAG: type II secretion system F family protein, partial [Campylobacterales bacterium]|nr:type II secretion system F family protein [Campylobacterales bacterium]